MTYKQESPFCIQMEMTEGCNLYCPFCGLQGIRDKKEKNLKFMTLKLADKIAQEIAHAKWNARIEFAMHGEPTMNPQCEKIIRIFRGHLPNNQLMITSNGGGLIKDSREKIEGLFNAGLNILAIDVYEYVKLGKKLRSAVKGKTFFKKYEYPKDRDASPHRRWPKGSQALVFIKDISVAVNGVHATLNNHCGSGAPLNYDGMGKRCAKPFRELSFRWNGRVAICCNTWAGAYNCGDIKKQSIEEIWQGKPFQVARKFLYRGMREFTPCLGCDATSYRVGLLPDKKGKIDLPRPTKKDRDYVFDVSSKRVMTKSVKPIIWRKSDADNE